MFCYTDLKINLFSFVTNNSTLIAHTYYTFLVGYIINALVSCHILACSWANSQEVKTTSGEPVKFKSESMWFYFRSRK